MSDATADFIGRGIMFPLRVDQSEDPRVRRLTMMSLKRLINQLTEEITRFESRAHSTR